MLFSIAEPTLPLDGRPKREAALKAETFLEDFLVQEEDYLSEPEQDDLSNYWPEAGLLKYSLPVYTRV